MERTDFIAGLIEELKLSSSGTTKGDAFVAYNALCHDFPTIVEQDAAELEKCMTGDSEGYPVRRSLMEGVTYVLSHRPTDTIVQLAHLCFLQIPTKCFALSPRECISLLSRYRVPVYLNDKDTSMSEREMVEILLELSSYMSSCIPEKIPESLFDSTILLGLRHLLDPPVGSTSALIDLDTRLEICGRYLWIVRDHLLQKPGNAPSILSSLVALQSEVTAFSTSMLLRLAASLLSTTGNTLSLGPLQDTLVSLLSPHMLKSLSSVDQDVSLVGEIIHAYLLPSTPTSSSRVGALEKSGILRALIAAFGLGGPVDGDEMMIESILLLACLRSERFLLYLASVPQVVALIQAQRGTPLFSSLWGILLYGIGLRGNKSIPFDAQGMAVSATEKIFHLSDEVTGDELRTLERFCDYIKDGRVSNPVVVEEGIALLSPLLRTLSSHIADILVNRVPKMSDSISAAGSGSGVTTTSTSGGDDDADVDGLRKTGSSTKRLSYLLRDIKVIVTIPGKMD